MQEIIISINIIIEKLVKQNSEVRALVSGNKNVNPRFIFEYVTMLDKKALFDSDKQKKHFEYILRVLKEI